MKVDQFHAPTAWYPLDRRLCVLESRYRFGQNRNPVIHLYIPTWQSPGGTEKNYEKPQCSV